MYRAPQAVMPDLRTQFMVRMCPMGSAGCHGSENRAMDHNPLDNFQMGQDSGVQYPVILTARHTWHCKALQ